MLGSGVLVGSSADGVGATVAVDGAVELAGTRVAVGTACCPAQAARRNTKHRSRRWRRISCISLFWPPCDLQGDKLSYSYATNCDSPSCEAWPAPNPHALRRG